MNCQSGIYKILNLVNGKFYIGSSINLYQRKANHISALKNNHHHSIHLQRAWNKYSEESFEFSILEYIFDNSIIIQREQYWIDFYKSYDGKIGYNISPTAGNCLGVACSEEKKLKISKTHIALKLGGEKNYMFGKNTQKNQREE